MSKAFTKEGDTPEAPTVRPVPTLASGEVRYITAEGHAALVAERTKFESDHAALRADPAMDAPARRVELEARIAGIDALLAILTVAEPPTQSDRVYFGAHVTLEDEEGKRSQYRIVGPDETDVKAGRISVDSPLARQLLGLSENDTIELQRPKGALELTVIAIRY